MMNLLLAETTTWPEAAVWIVFFSSNRLHWMVHIP